MAKQRYAKIPSYYREGHTVQAHRRQLSDVAYLELAEGPDDLQDLEFLLVPDPFNKRPPIYVREDRLYTLSNPDFDRLTAYSRQWNDKKKIKRIATRRTVARRTAGLREEGEGTDWGEVVEIVDTVISWFGGSGSSSGSSSSTDPGTYVSPSGYVFCIRNIGGQDVGFGLNPSGRSLIAFSSPSTVRQVFTNLPPNMGGSLPYIQLPSIVPQGLINLALRNPDKIVKIKPGTTDQYIVVGPISQIGTDDFGNPTPGTGSGSGSGSGSGNEHNEDPNINGSGSSSFASLLPIALIGGLLTLGK